MLRHGVQNGLRAVALAAPLLVLGAPVAAASDQWCSDDPPRVLTTPHGATVLVYETLGARGDLYLADLTLGLATTTYSATDATRGGVAGTLFTVSAPVPSDPLLGGFADDAVISSLPLGNGTVYAAATGASGDPLVMTFFYPAP